MKRHLRILLSWLCIAAILLCAVPAVADEETPESKPAPAITHYNLSFDNEVHLLYRIDFSAIPGFQPDKSNCGMLFWRSEPTDPIYENAEERILPKAGIIEGENAYIVKYTNLAAHQMCDIVWSRAYAIVDGEYRYSELVSYSIARYAETMLGYRGKAGLVTDEKLRQVLLDMLQYGKSMQEYRGYNLDHLPTDVLDENRLTVAFSSRGGTSINALSVCRNYPIAEPTAPTREGFVFCGWYHGDKPWNFETQLVTENLVLKAKWKGDGHYTEGLSFESNGDGTCSVTGLGSYTGDTVQIPPTYNGETVVAIGSKAFSENGQLKHIVIPDTVTVIRDCAFTYCWSLESVIMGNGVTEIGAAAFQSCNNLGDIEFSKNLKVIGDSAFEMCSNLYEIDLGQQVQSIGSRAFRDIRASDFTIPESVTELGTDIFGPNVSFATLTVPFWGKRADRKCEITFATLFGDSGYVNCLNILTVLGGTEIPAEAFTNMTSTMTTEIRIGEGIRSIGDNAFGSGSMLNTLRLPGTLTQIGEGVLNGLYNLHEIYFAGTKAEWNAITKPANWYPSHSDWCIICSDGTIPGYEIANPVAPGM